jgi:hypothetical protein
MDAISKIVSYVPQRGIYEYAGGAMTTTAVLMANVMQKLTNSRRQWTVGIYRIYLSATADAPNAFSFNNTTGRCYAADALVCQWDPTMWRAYWGSDTIIILWNPSASTYHYRGLNYTTTSSRSGATTGYVHYDANPGRTILNGAPVTISFPLLVGFYSIKDV